MEKCCNTVSNTVVEEDETDTIIRISNDVFVISTELKNQMDNLYEFFHGPRPEEQCDNGNCGVPNGFYKQIKQNLNFIRNNLLDIGQTMGCIR